MKIKILTERIKKYWQETANHYRNVSTAIGLWYWSIHSSKALQIKHYTFKHENDKKKMPLRQHENDSSERKHDDCSTIIDAQIMQ